MEFRAPPVNYKRRLATRFKIMAHLNIIEKRRPQDGRLTVEEDATKALLERVPKDPSFSQVPHSVRLIHGSPSREIVHLAGALKTDLIVISTHGRTGLKHWLLGSVAEQVIRHAHCAVLVVR